MSKSFRQTRIKSSITENQENLVQKNLNGSKNYNHPIKKAEPRTSSTTSRRPLSVVDPNRINEVQHYFKLSQETLYLSIALMDRILERREVDPDNLQLLGVASLYLSSKMDEYYPVDLNKLLHLTEDSYTIRQVLRMELVILSVVDFQIYVPTPNDFLNRLCRAALRPFSPRFLKTCHFLIDCHLPSYSHSALLPSLLASASVFVSSLLYATEATETNSSDNDENSILREVWTLTLQYYSTYNTNEVIPVALEMLTQCTSTRFSGAQKKYQSRSQHRRLMMEPHLATENIDRCKKLVHKLASDL